MNSKHNERIQDLLFRNATPETRAEELLVYMYECGLEGKILKESLIHIAEDYDRANSYELEMILLGYMLGQAYSSALEEDSNQIH